MERKIGEIFEHNGEWYQCVGSDMYDYCKGCASFKNLTCTSHYGNRDCWLKANCKNLEKVGTPFMCNYHGDNRLIMMQEYKSYDNRIIPPEGIPMYVTDYKRKRIAIGIKQNQEDMEENKLNLKPFDLEAARSGKPVCTRDGRNTRIICFDVKGTHPIIALVSDPDIEGDEIPFCYTNYGFYNNTNCESNHDLMMLPEKKEGWLNLYRDGGLTKAGWKIFPTKEEAENNFKDEEKYITTVKIEWEE